jgi:hypothetical protein
MHTYALESACRDLYPARGRRGAATPRHVDHPRSFRTTEDVVVLKPAEINLNEPKLVPRRAPHNIANCRRNVRILVN